MATRSEGTAAGVSSEAAGPSKRWLILAIVCTAYLMVGLDLTVMNVALPSAQKTLDFTNVDRQWIVTAYALSFGSLLLFCGRLADRIGRKETFLIGLTGFAIASAVGGASTSFTMLVTARACQGAFAALLAPSCLALLATTFTDSDERGKAFGIFSAVVTSGAGLGLIIGGALTSGLNWRWVPVRQSSLRRNLVRRRPDAAGPAAQDGRPDGRPWCDTGVGRAVLRGLRLLRDHLDEVQLTELTHHIALENLRGRFNCRLRRRCRGFSEGMVCAVPDMA